MITAAIIGAIVCCGATIAITASEPEPFWRAAAIVAGATLAGAGLGGFVGAAADSGDDCPPGTVEAAESNNLYTGCVPVELAKKQVETND